jgi:hypothetical protein
VSRRIRVKLDFTLILDHDVDGISDEWIRIAWAMMLAKTIDYKALGVTGVTNATRELSVVDEKGRVAT